MSKALTLGPINASSLRSWFRKSRFCIWHRSENENIFHCTVHKSASQWIRRIASDERIYRYCGLSSYQYTQEMPGKFDPRKVTQRSFDKRFPLRTFITPLYIDYNNFLNIPKPSRYKVFFVMRDPRDVLISWYFSSKYSHDLIGDQAKVREELNRLDLTDGLLYGIDHLDDFGLFGAQRSWADAGSNQDVVMLVRYEDLAVADNLSLFRKLCDHCDIRIPTDVLKELLQDNSFERLSGGRRRGEEKRDASYRKGVHGDWKNYFNGKIEQRFAEATGDLLAVWGYES